MKYQTLYSIALASSLSVLAACSSSGGGGGPSVPANAIAFDETNTASAVTMAVNITTNVLAAETQQMSANDGLGALSRALSNIRNNPNFLGARDVITGVATSFTELCYLGDILYSGELSGTAPYDSGSFSGSATFNACENYPGVVTSGSMSFSSTWTADGGYSDRASGNLTTTYTGIGDISLTGISFAETGNENNYPYPYSINTLSYTLDPSAGGGFAVQVTTPIAGNHAVFCPDSGVVLMTGANSTQARATFNSNDTITVEVNTGGGFTPVSGSPFVCGPV